MIPDAECVRIVAEILSDLKLDNFVIKVWYATISIKNRSLSPPPPPLGTISVIRRVNIYIHFSLSHYLETVLI